MIIVDTCVWSLAFRRHLVADGPAVLELQKLLGANSALMIGCVRQEFLSGISDQARFDRLRHFVTKFEDLSATSDDYETAAHFSNQCRRVGIAGSPTDMLISSIAYRYDVAIFTVDPDFDRYATVLPIQLHPLS